MLPVVDGRGRIATGEDIANLVSFLGSDQASYLNGAVYQVDGTLMAS